MSNNPKHLYKKMQSVDKIKKITSAMKMVAASKLTRSQKRLEAFSPFFKDVSNGFPLDIYKEQQFLNANRILLVVSSTDKGLCGGINTSIYKEVKNTINFFQEFNPKTEIKILCMGEKGNDLLKRTHAKYMVHSITGMSNKAPLNINAALNITDFVHDYNPDVCFVMFSKAISTMTNKASIHPISFSSINEETQPSNSLLGTASIEASFLKDYLYMVTTSYILHGLLENETSEMGARMIAMDNSTRNATELLAQLSLSYNRARQATITRELIEIISGKSAIESSK
uniref:ATP synthase F1 subunit gamma n=1 Tax=Meteora sporadica TaxID=2913902 RepID=UPI003001A1BD|nr:ATP synthase F1 subunit gamma [Meteora sporadica]